MITLPQDTYSRQWWLIWAVLLGLMIIPIGLTLSWYAFGWPEMRMWQQVPESHYAERITLVKYMISTALSIIGATWFLATRSLRRASRKGADYRSFSWAWTLLGIAVFAAIVQIYFSYKGFYSWRVDAEEWNVRDWYHVRYYWILRVGGMSYLVGDVSFLLGAILMVFALIKVLHKGVTTDQPERPSRRYGMR